MQAQRLQKILSLYSIASRRQAEIMISNGRVSVNGKVAKLGESADISVDVIEVDGTVLGKIEQYVYIMLNKPRGYLTTVNDDRGRKTVMELIADVGVRVYPVGRLDLNSEGLLLLTNDGDFAYKVMHPSFEKIKVYEVCVSGDISKAAELLKKPVRIYENDNIKPVTVEAFNIDIINRADGSRALKIALKEGRNRQVRKMCAACGVKVLSLRRVSVGDVKLGTLQSGKWRSLTKEEVELFG